MKLSAYMLTYNNARTVRQALASLDVADEIVVVDSGSSDGTLEIVRTFTDRVIHHDWPGFREQYQFAQDQCRYDWAFFLDADEEVAPTLAEDIRGVLTANAQLPAAEQTAGYQVRRRTFFIDRWIRHGGWASDHEIRLYRRDRGRWQGGLHAKVHVDGRERCLGGCIYHDTYSDIEDQVRTLNAYSSTAAADLDDAGKPVSLLRLLGNPPARFLKEYVLKGGFLDGIPGLVIAVNDMHYAFNKYAKRWERGRQREIDVVAARERRPEAGRAHE